ncbi:MAG: GNAT family N-acetyltransferase [Dehalococcoidia bacterium]|nr:GNAT family N-acetyltransferase [Dehalococcoidia bacterium]
MHRPLEGRLVRLRAREPRDEELAYQFFNDPEVTEFLAMRYPFSRLQEREALSVPARWPGAAFAIETLEEGRFVGTCSLDVVSAESRRAELGIAIGDKGFWNRGYGTDAVRTLCRFGFEEMNLHRVELEVFAENARARHVYERLGFVVEGARRDGWFQAGHYQDMIVMGLLEGELRLEG